MIQRIRPGDPGLAEGQAALERLREAAQATGLDRMPLKAINAVVEAVRQGARPKPRAKGR